MWLLMSVGNIASHGIIGIGNTSHTLPSTNETAYLVAIQYVQLIDFWFPCKLTLINNRLPRKYLTNHPINLVTICKTD